MHGVLAGLGAPKDKLVILPNGIRCADIPFRRRDGSTPRDALAIITVARLVEKKGVRFGIEAVAELRRAGLPARYTIVGAGPLLDELQDRARQLGVADVVDFAGAQPHARVLELLDAADVFLSPGVVAASGDVETQGVALLEAQAAGLPVVATRVGGVEETVADGRSGLLVAPADAPALAAALRTLYGDPRRWADMGQAGRAHVAAGYDRDFLMNRLIRLYHELCDRNDPR